MVSIEHPWTKFHIRSTPAKRKEEYYHLVHHYYMIHPLSKFALFRRFLMFFVLSGTFCIIPFIVIFLKMKRQYVFMGLSTLQLLFIAEMIMTFFTGYVNSHQVIMRHRRIVVRYLKTYFFFDLISIIPFFAKQLWWIYRRQYIFEYWKIFFIFENFKIARYGYWIKSYEVMMEYYGVSYNISSMIGFILRIIFVMFLLFSVRHCFREVDMSIDIEVMMNEHFDDFYDMVVQLLNVAHSMRETAWDLKEHAIIILFLCFGFAFLIEVTCLFWQHLNKYFATALNENMLFGQYEAYASFTGISQELKDRIQMYLDFKYRGEYYKEHVVRTILSPELVRETRISISKSRLERVKLFSAIPLNIRTSLEECLLSDTYLPGDIIIKAGTKGRYLYLIVSGTVMVTSPTGEHICCLEDDANFGEIAFILNENRGTTIIAATPCELLILKRSDYELIMYRHPNLEKKLRQQALARLQETTSETAVGPVCRLFDPSSSSRSSPGNIAEYKLYEEREEFANSMRTGSSRLLFGFAKTASITRRSSHRYTIGGQSSSSTLSLEHTHPLGSPTKMSSIKVQIEAESRKYSFTPAVPPKTGKKKKKLPQGKK